MEQWITNTKIFCLLFLWSVGTLQAQEADPVKVFVDTRIVNGHSVELNPEGVMKFIIEHRFGNIGGGIGQLYGLDQSTIRIGFDYGFKDWIGVGVGRSSFEKTVDGYLKVNLMRQGPQPISLTVYSDMSINTSKWQNPDRENQLVSKIDYAHQLLIGRKVTDNFSVQLMPSLVHRNLVATREDNNDIYALGIAGRYKITKMIALATEYYYVPEDQLPEGNVNSLAFGIELETKGHVFQMHLGNSAGIIEEFFITGTRDRWDAGGSKFGFNITRDFKLKGRK